MLNKIAFLYHFRYLWIRNWCCLIAILCFRYYQYRGVWLSFFSWLYWIYLSLMFRCVTPIILLWILITLVIPKWWLGVVSLSVVIAWTSVLWIESFLFQSLEKFLYRLYEELLDLLFEEFLFLEFDWDLSFDENLGWFEFDLE